MAFLTGKPHGQRSLASYTLWGHKRVGHFLATKITILHTTVGDAAERTKCWVFEIIDS